jgi:hypothetical protein
LTVARDSTVSPPARHVRRHWYTGFVLARSDRDLPGVGVQRQTAPYRYTQ